MKTYKDKKEIYTQSLIVKDEDVDENLKEIHRLTHLKFNDDGKPKDQG